MFKVGDKVKLELDTLKIEIPKPKAYVVYGANGYTTQIAIYKKPNLVFKWLVWSAGWRIEEVEG